MSRSNWHEYFMGIATQVATRATCDRKHVGAVIVKDRIALSMGYNGSIKGTDHCDDVGHLMEDGHCVRTVHAEVNAVVQAAKNGIAIDGASIYITCNPCWNCFKTITNAGIKSVIYGEFYRDPEMLTRETAVMREIQGAIGRLSDKGIIWDYMWGLRGGADY